MATAEEEVYVDLRKLKMTELRKELQDRGLKTSGNKQDLVDRLEQYMQEHEGAEVADDELLKEEGEADEHLNDDHKIEDVSLTSDKEQEKTAVPEAVTENDDKDAESEITALQTPAVAVTDEERLKLRAKKFGLTTADMNPDARKAARSARFGTGGGAQAPGADVLKKRVERFGNVAADTPKGSADDERRRKRLARFGGDAATADSGDVDKKKQRAERFGLVA